MFPSYFNFFQLTFKNVKTSSKWHQTDLQMLKKKPKKQLTYTMSNWVFANEHIFYKSRFVNFLTIMSNPNGFSINCDPTSGCFSFLVGKLKMNVLNFSRHVSSLNFTMHSVSSCTHVTMRSGAGESQPRWTTCSSLLVLQTQMELLESRLQPLEGDRVQLFLLCWRKYFPAVCVFLSQYWPKRRHVLLWRLCVTLHSP